MDEDEINRLMQNAFDQANARAEQKFEERLHDRSLNNRRQGCLVLLFYGKLPLSIWCQVGSFHSIVH